MRFTGLLLLPPLFLLGCASAPDPELLEVGLATAASVGRVTTLALAAAEGIETGCGDVAEPCAGYPCERVVEIVLDEDCPLPLMGAATGTIAVEAELHDAERATLDFSVVDVSFGTRAPIAVSASDLEARRFDGETLYIDFSSSDTRVLDESLVGVDSARWELTVQLAGTPGDVTDDTIVVDGSFENIETANIQTVTVDGARLDPSCLANPIAGSAALDSSALLRSNDWDVAFHEECDGRADFTMGSTATSVELDFLR